MIMKILRSRAGILVFFLVAVLFVVYDATHAADDEATAQIKQESARLKEQRATIRKSEEAITQSLERSRKALATTAERGDAESRRIAQDAVAEAQEALDTVQNLQAKLESRVRSFDNALRLPKSAREYGIATISLGQVRIDRKTGSFVLEPGSKVLEEESVATGRAAYGELYLPDGTFVMLGPESVFIPTEVDRANRILMADLKKGRVHVEKNCSDGEGARCWATRYTTGSGFISFGKAELVYEQRTNGTETLTVLDGAVVYREKRSRKATTLQVGDRLEVGLNGEVVSVKKVAKDDIQSWWDPDIRVSM